MPVSGQYCALVTNNGSDIRFIESIFPPKIEVADFPDQIDLNSSNVFHATICNSIPRKLERTVRVELIQDGTVKGWSPGVNASWEPEGTIDLELSVDNWIWKDKSNSHPGKYVLCLSIRNTYGDIWIPMGQGKKVTVSDSAGIDAVKVDDIAEDAMYDLYGRRVSGDTNALSSGLYVRLHNGVVSKIVIH